MINDKSIEDEIIKALEEIDEQLLFKRTDLLINIDCGGLLLSRKDINFEAKFLSYMIENFYCESIPASKWLDALTFNIMYLDKDDIKKLNTPYSHFFDPFANFREWRLKIGNDSHPNIYNDINSELCTVVNPYMMLFPVYNILSRLEGDKGCHIISIANIMGLNRGDPFVRESYRKFLRSEHTNRELYEAIINNMMLKDTVLHVYPESFFELKDEIEQLSRVLYTKLMLKHIVVAVDLLRFIGLVEVTIAGTIWNVDKLKRMCETEGLIYEEILADFPSRKKGNDEVE